MINAFHVNERYFRLARLEVADMCPAHRTLKTEVLVENSLERVMNSGENGIGMRGPRSAWFLRDLRFPHSYAVSNRVHNTL
jgi:hypothetical protein